MCYWDIIPIEQEGSLSFLGLIPKILSLIVYHGNSEKSLFGTGQGGSFIYNPPPHSHALPRQRSRKLFINTIWWTCTHLQPKTQNREKQKSYSSVFFPDAGSVISFWLLTPSTPTHCQISRGYWQWKKKCHLKTVAFFATPERES